MIEGRAVVESVEKARHAVESLGGEFKGHYVLRDIIFLPREGEPDLNREFVRVRINIKSDRKTKKVILVKKQTDFTKGGKISRVVLRKEFDAVEEAFGFVERNMPELQKGFEFGKEGWEYRLDNSSIFIEDISGWKPSVEIVSENEEQLNELFRKIGIVERLDSCVPEIMRRIMEHSQKG